MAVVSQLLATGSTGAGPTSIYTVPTGRRTIVKSLIVKNAGGAAGAVTFTVHHGGVDTAIFDLWCAASGTNGATQISQPWLVLDEGDALKITFPAGAGGWYTISGAELVL